MKVVVLGTRGIPDIQGGVETHCQELYPRIAAMGNDVTVICRSCYLPKNHPTEFQGVRLLSVYAPRKKAFEAIVHTFLGIFRARSLNPDVLHIHAIGPSIMVPLARMIGMRVVTTNHGPDYDRGKWGRAAKAVLRLGQRLGTRFSNRVIVISRVIADILAQKYGRTDTDLIFNGVPSPIRLSDDSYIRALGMAPGRYVVALGRFVPEKGFHDLINAWKLSGLASRGFCLAIAGDADHPDEYSSSLKAMATETPGVVLTGFIRGEKLWQLLSHSALFAMPSYHEGLPIALLEAMSYDLDVIVSDIPACRIPELNPATDSFPVGDVNALAQMLLTKLSNPAPRSYDLSAYDWDRIAQQVLDLYRSLLR